MVVSIMKELCVVDYLLIGNVNSFCFFMVLFFFLNFYSFLCNKIGFICKFFMKLISCFLVLNKFIDDKLWFLMKWFVKFFIFSILFFIICLFLMLIILNKVLLVIRISCRY